MPTPTSPSNDADDAIYPELARANLARLRGDYDLAERQCMELLKQSPHSVSVAALLGDVSAEQGKLDEAVQWYEMAVDAGAASGIEEKLEAIRVRIGERDAASAEREIGLAQSSWLTPPIIVGSAVILAMLVIGAYVAGTYRTPARLAPPAQQSPIVLPASGPSVQPPSPNTTEPGGQTVTPVQPGTPAPDTTAPAAKGGFDTDLQGLAAASSGVLSRLSGAIANPRDHSVTLDVALQTGEDARGLAAQVVQAAMPSARDATTVTVRVMSGGRPVYVADGTRDRFDAYSQQEHPAADAAGLADALLTNEWREGQTASTNDR